MTIKNKSIPKFYWNILSKIVYISYGKNTDILLTKTQFENFSENKKAKLTSTGKFGEWIDDLGKIESQKKLELATLIFSEIKQELQNFDLDKTSQIQRANDYILLLTQSKGIKKTFEDTGEFPNLTKLISSETNKPIIRDFISNNSKIQNFITNNFN